MKVTPVTGPGDIKPTGTPEHVRTAKAINAFNKASQQQAELPPVNPNAITTEEMSAVAPKTEQPKEIATVETPVADTPQEEPKQDPALSRQFAQLARQERTLQAKAKQQDAALKAREAAITAKEAELQAQANLYRTDYIQKARLKQDALGVLEAEGIATYDDLTQRAISRQPVDPQLQAKIDKLEATITELKTANENTQKSYQEQQQQNYQEAIKQITRDARDLVKVDPAFEAIRATGSVKDVVDLIKRQHAKDGTVLSVEEAAQAVEEYLVEEATKLTRIEKIKQRMNQSSATKGPSTQQTQASKQTQPTMKTLTNATTSARTLSAKERAILAFKGELKG